MLDDKSDEFAGEEENDLGWSLRRLFEVSAEHFPYPVLLSSAAVGDVLQLLPHPQPDKHALLVRYQDQIAGFISLQDHTDLVARVRRGERYEAVISENYGGRCRVLIRRDVQG
jgi:hypothetical protein